MKDEDEYRDYLVDKAKEIMEHGLSTTGEKTDRKPEIPKKRGKWDEKAEEDSTSKIPFAWDPREVKHLAENRKKMTNDELKEFFEKDDDFHEELKDIDDWQGFSRWEERFLVQNYRNLDASSMAEELGRDVKEVKLKMRILGMKPDE